MSMVYRNVNGEAYCTAFEYELHDILKSEYESCYDYVLFGDADDSYDWALLESIEEDARKAGLDIEKIKGDAWYIN